MIVNFIDSRLSFDKFMVKKSIILADFEKYRSLSMFSKPGENPDFSGVKLLQFFLLFFPRISIKKQLRHFLNLNAD